MEQEAITECIRRSTVAACINGPTLLDWEGEAEEITTKNVPVVDD